jgi:hypothetical protein
VDANGDLLDCDDLFLDALLEITSLIESYINTVSLSYFQHVGLRKGTYCHLHLTPITVLGSNDFSQIGSINQLNESDKLYGGTSGSPRE